MTKLSSGFVVQSVKINFCGDSFCEQACEQSWTLQLATALNATIVGLGRGGTAYERAIRTFDSTVDYTVFCWTEPHRIHHPTLKISIGYCDQYKEKNKHYMAGYYYYKYLHDFELTKERYTRELYWFDNAVLSKYKGKAVHLFSFECLFGYTFENGTTFTTPLNHRRERPSAAYTKGEVANHLTAEQNNLLAKELYQCLK